MPAEPLRAVISDAAALPDLPKTDDEPYDGSPTEGAMEIVARTCLRLGAAK